LRKQHTGKAKHERDYLNGYAEISRDTGAENIGQCGEEEVERAGKSKGVFQISASNILADSI